MTRDELETAYQRAVQQRNYAWRRERKRSKEASSSAKPTAGVGGMRATSERTDAGEKATADRRHRLFKILNEALRRRPSSDHAHAIDLLIQSLSAEQRSTLRALSSIQQERYIAQREICRKLRSDYFTPRATLTLRLENFMPTRAIDRANTALSKKQLDDGTWRRPVLIELPKASQRSNRALGIYQPVRMFNVFSSPKYISSALDEL
eukprot:5890626-Pleurochrysis_carterae.AAC.1